jgi:hypothetical protein
MAFASLYDQRATNGEPRMRSLVSGNGPVAFLP